MNKLKAWIISITAMLTAAGGVAYVTSEGLQNAVKGQCQKAVDAIEAIQDESIQMVFIEQFVPEECYDQLGEYFERCRDLGGGFTCRKGKLYGPGKGGLDDCVPPADAPLCLHHREEIKHLGLDNVQTLERVLNKINKHQKELEGAQ